MPHRVGGLFKWIITRENIVGAWEDYNRNRPVYRRREIDEPEVDSILAEFGMTMKKDWQIYPTAKRGVRIAGQSIKASGMTRLYPRINRNMRRAFKRAFNNPTEHNLASAMSYVGWLKSVNRIHILLDLIKEEKQKCRLILLPLLVPMS